MGVLNVMLLCHTWSNTGTVEGMPMTYGSKLSNSSCSTWDHVNRTKQQHCPRKGFTVHFARNLLQRADAASCLSMGHRAHFLYVDVA